MDAVVVSYNSRSDLQAFAAAPAHRAAFDRVVVVDNASSDDSGEVARTAGFDLVELENNHGFGYAANLGIARTDSAWVALLNPDVVLPDEGVLERLVDASQADVGVIAPALQLPDGSIQDSARSSPRLTDLMIRRFFGRRTGAIDSQRACDVPWVVGATMVFRRAAFVEVGGFDPSFRLYFEDVDICERLRGRGWRVRYDPTVTFLHTHRAASRAPLWSPATREHIRSAALYYGRRTMRRRRRLNPA